MYNIIPLILILISISVIIVIAARKFSVLANIDVDNIPAEKEAKFKELIISNRLKRYFIKWTSKVKRFAQPAGRVISNFFKWIYNKLYELKDEYKSDISLSKADAKQKVRALIEEAEELIRREDLVLAEKKLIEAINFDNKNLEAFRKLGLLYFARKNYEEAKETFEHILKLQKEEDGEIYLDLALIYEKMENMDESAANINKALKIEPNNPRFLDAMIEISIIKKDKILALNAYKRLKEANPENKKLNNFKAQIDAM